MKKLFLLCLLFTIFVGCSLIRPHNYKNLLVIGNSISRSPADANPSLWRGDHGMAASTPEADYVHLLARKLQLANPNLTFYSEYFISRNWERAHYDYDLALFDPLFVADAHGNVPDLVLIRLGENVSDTTHYQDDLLLLIDHVKAALPNATVIVTGILWPDASNTKDAAQLAAAKAAGVTFVSLAEIDGPETRATVNVDTYLGADGVVYTIDDPGVASHPNNHGMSEIFARIDAAL